MPLPRAGYDDRQQHRCLQLDADRGAGRSTPSVTITVTDDGTGNLVDSETFTITVNEVNVAPVLDPIGDQSVDELGNPDFTATASDSDLPADTLTFSLDAASMRAGHDDHRRGRLQLDADRGAGWADTLGDDHRDRCGAPVT